MFRDFQLNPYLLHVNHINEKMCMGECCFPERYTMFHELDIITQGGGRDVVDGKEYTINYGDVFYRVPGMHNQHFFLINAIFLYSIRILTVRCR